jgi:hypothetical protein
VATVDVGAERRSGHQFARLTPAPTLRCQRMRPEACGCTATVWWDISATLRIGKNPSTAMRTDPAPISFKFVLIFQGWKGSKVSGFSVRTRSDAVCRLAIRSIG